MRAELEHRAAAGDARAARRLGMVFANCNRYVPIAEDRLESWVVDVAANDISISLGERKLAPEELLARVKLSQAQKARDCKDVVGLNEDDATALAAHWIERGAALGDADAQATYGALAFSSFQARTALADAESILERKQRAMGYLQSSLAQGDALALLHLSSHYAAGDLYPMNAETAYAYHYAYSLTPRAADVVPEWLQQMLEAGAKPLDESARQRARAQGVQIAACCAVAPREGP